MEKLEALIPTLLYMEMSLNGLICRADDSVTWTEAAWKNYFAVCREYGNIIIGRTSFETIPPEELHSLHELQVIIVSKSLDSSSVKLPNAEVVRSPEAALKYLIGQGFKQALIGGGKQLNTAFFQKNLVDQVGVDIEPIMFASGKSFLGPLPQDINLQLNYIKELGSGSVHLRYQVLK